MELRDKTREQVRLILSGVSELTEADVERMADDITTAARARLEAAAPDERFSKMRPDEPGAPGDEIVSHMVNVGPDAGSLYRPPEGRAIQYKRRSRPISRILSDFARLPFGLRATS